MERRDVVIVGAGPAGSTCAWKLRQSGLDVLVVDRASFPRDKTCAGWITPAVLEILQVAADHYGQGRVLEPITGFRVGVVGGRSIEVRFDRPVSYGIRRCEFDRYLIERSGAEFRPATAVTSLRRDGHRWKLNGEIEANVIVGAGGHFCPAAREINPRGGLEPAVVTEEAEVLLEGGSASAARPGVPEFYFSPDFKGYGWVFRKGPYVTVGLGRQDPNHLPSHLRTFLEFLDRQGRGPGVRRIAWKGHAYLLYGSSRRNVVGEGIVLVGDAAGVAHPRSGEGILSAIESGRLAAETIVEARGDFSQGKLGTYPRRLRDRFGQPAWAGGISRVAPEQLTAFVARRLLGSEWFVRHILLERWFLHAA
jgi:geranylgeranyl reductase family protein